MDREKIVEAMGVVQSACKENRSMGICLDCCPFYYGYGCYIRDVIPEAWKSNKSEGIWRAYQEE